MMKININVRKESVTGILFLLTATLVGCQKEVRVDKTFPNEAMTTRAAIESPPDFDWENATYLSTNTGAVRMPWLTGQNTFVPYSHNFDMKKENGWELIYNDAPEPGNSTPMLIFYNIPRGVMRFYIYANNTNISANSLLLNLSFSKASSILASATGKTQIAPTPANAAVTLVGMKSDQELSGFSVGFWHCGEFDVSYYDGYNNGNIVGTISGNATTISNLKITGTSEGTIEGSIVAKNSSTTSNVSLIGRLSFNRSSKAGEEMKKSLDEAQADNPDFFKQLWNKVKSSAKNGAINSVGDLAGKVASGAIDWATNPLMSLFDSFIGGNAKSTPQEFAVNLTTNSKIELEGTMSTTLPAFSKSFNIPLNNPIEGQVSNLNQKIGVWYLSAQPKIVHSAFANPPRQGSMYYTVSDNVSIGDFNVLINPTIGDKYEIRNVEKYMVVAKSYGITAGMDPAYYQDKKAYYKTGGWWQRSTMPDWDGYSRIYGFVARLFVSFYVVEKATGQETFHLHQLDYKYVYNSN